MNLSLRVRDRVRTGRMHVRRRELGRASARLASYRAVSAMQRFQTEETVVLGRIRLSHHSVKHQVGDTLPALPEECFIALDFLVEECLGNRPVDEIDQAHSDDADEDLACVEFRKSLLEIPSLTAVRRASGNRVLDVRPDP